MPDAGRTVRISLAIMTLASYMALATTESFGPEISLVPLALVLLMPVFERFDARYPSYRRFTNIVTMAFIILIIPVLFTRLLTGLTAVIMYIQAYLFLHRKSPREYRYLFLMAFFLLVDAVAQSPDPAFGLVMPLFVLSAVWAFASVQIYAESLANRHGNIADLLPAESRRGFLPPEVMQWVRGQRGDSVSVAPVLTALSIGCVVVTMLFFIFTPRMEAGVFGTSNVLQPTIRTGLDEGVDLSRGGNLAENEATVFLARFPNEPNGRPTPEPALYWRVTSYNELIGAEWRREPFDLVEYNWISRGRELRRPPIYGGRQIEQEIFLEDSRSLVGLPALSEPMAFLPPQNTRFRVDDLERLTVTVQRSSSQTFTYRVVSEMREFTPGQLRAAPADYSVLGPGDLARFTAHRLSERARALARTITADFESPHDKATAIENYLRNAYLYTTSLSELPEDSPIDAFLFDRRTGHCELFASTMCMLVRSLGIPARVVSGYKQGEWSDADQAYIIRQKHAHLWVEVYLRNIGWYPYDPSGAPPLDNSFWGRFNRSLTRYLLNAKILYYRDIVGFSSGIQLGNLVSFTIGLIRFDVDVMRNAIPSMSMFAQGIPRFILILTLVSAVAWGIYVMYRSASHRRRAAQRYALSEDQIRATRLYRRLRHRFERSRQNGEAPRSARELLRAALDDPTLDHDAVASIIRAYNDTRFGGRPMPKQYYRELARSVNSLKRGGTP